MPKLFTKDIVGLGKIAEEAGCNERDLIMTRIFISINNSICELNDTMKEIHHRMHDMNCNIKDDPEIA